MFYGETNHLTVLFVQGFSQDLRSDRNAVSQTENLGRLGPKDNQIRFQVPTPVAQSARGQCQLQTGRAFVGRLVGKPLFGEVFYHTQ